MKKYIFIVLCVFCIAFGCKQKSASAGQPFPKNVEMIAIAEPHETRLTVVAVHDDKREVTCYISLSDRTSDFHMDCIEDPGRSKPYGGK